MLVEAPAIPWWGWVFIGLVLILMILFLLRLGYTVYSEITGFGLHVVKETETFEYEGEEAKNPAPKESQAQKRSITTERQTPRTIWDWMTVLTISAVIGVVALIFTWSQAEQQRYVQDQQAKDAVLQEYLDKMTQMMLDDDDPLVKAEAGSPERAAARARTVTALKRLDAEHNAIVLTFLRESGLVSARIPGAKEDKVVKLEKTPLNGVELANTNSLSGLSLRFARLRKADLHDTNLGVTNLSFADLANADLSDADLRNTDLLFANLVGADLEGANFHDARLRGADLRDAHLKTAKNLTQNQIDQAGAVDSETQLPPDLDTPTWWSNNTNDIVTQPMTVPVLRDYDFGATLVSLKSLNPKHADLREAIGIPGRVGRVGNTQDDTQNNESDETQNKTDGDTNEDTKPPPPGNTGVLVYDVRHGSLAQTVGLRPGDIIVRVDQKQVRGLEDLKHTLDEYQAGRGKRVEFATWRYYFPNGWRKGSLSPKFGD